MYENMRVPSAFTIDVEDGINISMRDNFRQEMEPTERVISNVDVILDICASNEVKATFFILGEVAEKYPDLVRRISKEGHEIGVHGYYHDQVFKLTPAKFEEEMRRAKGLLENITGKEVPGHRAPAFSIGEQTAWALPVLAKCGFKYDSSIVPTNMSRYGWAGFPRDMVKLNLENDLDLVEVPIPVLSILGRKLPVCGGGYLRYFPLFFTDRAFSSILRSQPVIMYMHPYELDTEKYPDYFYEGIRSLSLRKALPLYIYRFQKGTVRRKLHTLLGKYTFMPLQDIIAEREAGGMIKEVSLNDFRSQE